MVKFRTSTGTVTVDNWGYALQGLNGNDARADQLAQATHDLLVIDSSRDGTNAGRFSHDFRLGDVVLRARGDTDGYVAELRPLGPR